MKRRFIVTLNLPEGVSREDMRQYINDAVRAWKGQCKPASACEDDDDWYDPITELNEETVVVK